MRAIESALPERARPRSANAQERKAAEVPKGGPARWSAAAAREERKSNVDDGYADEDKTPRPLDETMY